MLRTVNSGALAPSTEINRKNIQPAQEIALSPFGRACWGLWGVDAALVLASRTKSGVRVAEYKMVGRVKPNGLDVAVIVIEITKRS